MTKEISLIDLKVYIQNVYEQFNLITHKEINRGKVTPESGIVLEELELTNKDFLYFR